MADTPELTPQQKEVYAILDRAIEKVTALELQAASLPKDKGYAPQPAGPDGSVPSGAQQDNAFRKAGLAQPKRNRQAAGGEQVDRIAKGMNVEERDGLLKDMLGLWSRVVGV